MTASTATHVIEVQDVYAGYVVGFDILRGLSLTVARDGITAVIGANGAGKSTLMKAILGLVEIRAGQLLLFGAQVRGVRPHSLVRRGLAYVPQIDNVFSSMTVEENSRVGAGRIHASEYRDRLEVIATLFPEVVASRQRVAGVLSGGQRQMVAMSRALISDPRCILLDEPSAGLAPRYVDAVFEKILQIRQSGVAILIVEQNARRALDICDVACVLELGRTRFSGTGAAVLNNPELVSLYLGSASSSEPDSVGE